MTVQLEQILPIFSQLDYAEQEAFIKQVRHRKYVERPAAQQRKRKATKKAEKPKVNKIMNLAKNLTPEQLEALLEDLENGASEN